MSSLLQNLGPHHQRFVRIVSYWDHVKYIYILTLALFQETGTEKIFYENKDCIHMCYLFSFFSP